MDRSPAQIAVKRGTLATGVYDQVREEILAAIYLPDQKLPVDVLCYRYGVGASPVREALNRLVSEGLVILEDQKGFRVAPVSLEELNELTQTRCLLNEVALRESIARGDEAWEEKIVITFHRLQRALREPSDPIARARAHRDFHSSLIEACGSRWLISFADLLFDSGRRYQGLSFKMGTKPRDIGSEHRSIMDAVLGRDVDLAVKLLNDHIAATTRIVSQLDLLRPATIDKLQ